MRMIQTMMAVQIERSRRVREGVKALKPAITVCVQPELEEWE